MNTKAKVNQFSFVLRIHTHQLYLLNEIYAAHFNVNLNVNDQVGHVVVDENDHDGNVNYAIVFDVRVHVNDYDYVFRMSFLSSYDKSNLNI